MKRVTLRQPEKHWAEFQAACESRGISENAAVTQAVRLWLDSGALSGVERGALEKAVAAVRAKVAELLE